MMNGAIALPAKFPVCNYMIVDCVEGAFGYRLDRPLMYCPSFAGRQYRRADSNRCE